MMSSFFWICWDDGISDHVFGRFMFVFIGGLYVKRAERYLCVGGFFVFLVFGGFEFWYSIKIGVRERWSSLNLVFGF